MTQQELRQQVDELERALRLAAPSQVSDLQQQVARMLRTLRAKDMALAGERQARKSHVVQDADEDFFDNMPV